MFNRSERETWPGAKIILNSDTGARVLSADIVATFEWTSTPTGPTGRQLRIDASGVKVAQALTEVVIERGRLRASIIVPRGAFSGDWIVRATKIEPGGSTAYLESSGAVEGPFPWITDGPPLTATEIEALPDGARVVAEFLPGEFVCASIPDESERKIVARNVLYEGDRVWLLM